jgi:2-dehydro-3-deoxygluconokinase
MLRLDPGEGRIRTARSFHAWEGGGEYNVARGLRRVFGQRAAIMTALVDNEIGHLIEDLILCGGVDTQWIRWVDDDGIGLSARNGLNFTERGFGVRGAVGVSDRGHSATSLLRPGDLDFDALFAGEGSRWFHTGGIFAALSESTAEVAIDAMQAARRHGTVVSYDLNYRPSLWRAKGGREAAQRCNRRAVQFADVLFGNEEDFAACLGYQPQGVDQELSELPVASYATMVAQVAADYPNLRVIATSLRAVRSATRNDWGGLAWSAGTGVVQATQRDELEILDRVGGGDSFASGLIFGILDAQPLSTALEYGAAHGALAMTTPGDTSMAALGEVQRLMRGGNARVNR